MFNIFKVSIKLKLMFIKNLWKSSFLNVRLSVGTNRKLNESNSNRLVEFSVKIKW